MTSSPTDPDAPEAPKKVPGWRQPWDRWRIMMLAGSIVLLGLAFSQFGDKQRLPEWAMTAIYVLGYGLLAFGFYLAMQQRRGSAQKKLEEQKRKKVSPRDPG